MAEKKKYNYAKELTKGFLKENPVLRLVLGTCPTLATSTSVINGVGMGIAATIVLICSNVVISAMRKVIPEKARIPAYIVIIASFVTMVQMLVKAFVPALDQSLGVFLPLIVVNCIILGRAEAYASKNPVLVSAIDGLGMGIGFTAALFIMGAVREILGAGTFLSGIDTMLGAYIDLGSFTGFDFTDKLANIGLAPMTLFILPAGGFFVFGILMALANRLAEKKGLQSATLNGCKGCPHASFCGKFSENGENITEACAAAAENKETEIKEKKEEAPAPKTEEIKEPVQEEEKNEEPSSDNNTESKEQEAPPENKSKKKKRKKNKPQTPAEDFIEPLPEVIPEFLRKDIENNKDKEESKV
ncbi:MAG: electron transport complex subunit E [Clostridia bacterium]|nr:electron transport complex subunit E [Clostridia bacterium]